MHLYKYVTNLNVEAVKKYDNLRPVLVAEERKPPEPELFKNKGIQAGSIQDSEEAKEARMLNLEF